MRGGVVGVLYEWGLKVSMVVGGGAHEKLPGVDAALGTASTRTIEKTCGIRSCSRRRRSEYTPPHAATRSCRPAPTIARSHALGTSREGGGVLELLLRAGAAGTRGTGAGGL